MVAATAALTVAGAGWCWGRCGNWWGRAGKAPRTPPIMPGAWGAAGWYAPGCGGDM